MAVTKKTAVRKPGERPAKVTGSTHAYETLRDEILALRLAPGQALDETSLAERFGMSRSPIREALIRLASDELVVILQNRSTVVAPLDVMSFPKYVEALDVAQRMCTRLAAELRSNDDLVLMEQRQRDFEASVQSGKHLAMSKANKDFHMAVAQAGKNPFLSGFYEKLLDQGRRMLHLHFDFIERTRQGYLLTDEHRDMIEAIRARDVERADALAHAHTRIFRDNFLDYLKENYSRGTDLGAPPSLDAARPRS